SVASGWRWWCGLQAGAGGTAKGRRASADLTGWQVLHFTFESALRFLSELANIPANERIAMVEKLNEDDKFSGRAGAAVIEILDRMESEKKPELAAKCFAAYAREEISFLDLRRILPALEKLPAFDLEEVRVFSETRIEDAMKMDESLLLAFVNAGLGKNNGGLDGGAILPTSLCKLIVKIDLVP
ncbi:hypothetical protein, partial [Acidovorax sp.]|uniref:hypothetical protein n=1 Tax=Acidovorax sp. TaxID=1872122 RepID=UPI003BAF88A5